MGPHISTWVLLGLATSPLASAHIALRQPVPYDAETLHGDRGPITQLENNYPCHTSNFAWSGDIPEMAVGEDQPLSFYPRAGELAEGVAPAVHDGGTCQLSISLDVPPTPQSTFKVIKTIQGTCPGIDGDVRNFTYQIPKSIPSGKAVFAWTWFPVFSGEPEMYMNCAPIKVVEGATDTSAFDQLPDILVANYNDSCTRKSQSSFVMRVPNPGEVLEEIPNPSHTDTALPVGPQCGKTASGEPATAGSASAASSTSQTLAASTPSPVAAGQPGADGGAFVETAASGSEAAAAAPSTTFATTTSASGNAVTAAGQAGTPAASTPSDGSGSIGECKSSSNGQLFCNGTTHFGFCNWGKITWQSVADGTICENGTIKAAAARIKERRAAHVHAHGRLSAGRQFHA